MNKKEYKELKKKFDDANVSQQKSDFVKNLTKSGKIKLEDTTSGFKAEVSLTPSVDFGKIIDEKSLVVDKCDFKLKLEKNIDPLKVKVKTEIDGKVKEGTLDKLDFEFKFEKEIESQEVTLQFEFEGDMLQFNSPMGEKDFECKFMASKRF